MEIRHPKVAELVQAIASKLSPGRPYGGENMCRSLALLSFAAIAAAEEDGEASIKGIMDRLSYSDIVTRLNTLDGLRGQFARAYVSLLPGNGDATVSSQTILDIHGINVMEVIKTASEVEMNRERSAQ